jgi:hypothetical protein
MNTCAKQNSANTGEGTTSVLAWNTEESQEQWQSGQLVARQRFELGTSRIEVTATLAVRSVRGSDIKAKQGRRRAVMLTYIWKVFGSSIHLDNGCHD